MLLQSQVRASMQDFYDDPSSNLKSWNIVILTVQLIKTSDHTYEGVATMTADDGPQRDIPVHVRADDRNMMWNIDPGALAPLFR